MKKGGFHGVQVVRSGRVQSGRWFWQLSFAGAALMSFWPFKDKRPAPQPAPLAYSWSGDGVGRPEPPKQHGWLWAMLVIFLLVLLLAWVVPALF